LDSISTTGKLDDDTETDLKTALENYTNTFNG